MNRTYKSATQRSCHEKQMPGKQTGLKSKAMTHEEKQQLNWESRQETLQIMFKRFIEAANELGPYSAVVYTGPMTEVLIHAITELRNHRNQKITDEAINKALKKS